MSLAIIVRNHRTYRLEAWKEFMRWPDDPLTYFAADITCNGKLVGRMFTGPGSAYPDKFYSNINQLRWAGPMPQTPDSRFYDLPPLETQDKAIEMFIRQAEGIFEYRRDLDKDTTLTTKGTT